MMLGEDLKRPASTPSTNPKPTKKMHLEAQPAQDIFGGDEREHNLADEDLRRRHAKYLRLLAENCRMASSLSLQDGIETVISNVPSLCPPEDGVILRKLDDTPGFREFVQKCFEDRDYRSIRNLGSLRGDAVTGSQSSSNVDITEEQTKAAVEAWKQPYIGEAHMGLYEVMVAHQENQTAYGRFLSVVQSSGTGKSRMVDELSKGHFVIPINLRPKGERGFPAADHDVREFFDRGTLQREVYAVYAAFLSALFQQLLIHFHNIDINLSIHNLQVDANDSIASKFHLLMTQGQTFNAPNEYRRMFYQQVCQKAEDLLKQNKDEPMTGVESTGSLASLGNDPDGTSEVKQPLSPPLGFDGGINLYDAAREVVHFLEPSSKVKQKLDDLPPVIILAFDEAHQLTRVQDNADRPWSRFSELRRNIRKLMTLPVFSLFISTVSKISDLTPATKQDMSTRIVNETLTLLPPFTELGLDQLLEASPIEENTIKIQDATTDHFMCQFGRPLFGTRFNHIPHEIVEFAASKLICGESQNILPTGLDDDQKLACMAVRLALEFNSTTSKSQERERLQVAKHMRICIKVNDGFETIVSVAPSEPIMAEGARSLMSRTKFNLPESLLHELQIPGLDKGNRGELVSLVLLLLACDKAAKAARAFPVHTFFQNLLNDDDYAELLKAKPSRGASDDEPTFQETFANSKIYFNHFIKIDDPRVVNRKYLWMLIARGAAVLCATNQVGMDILVPFTFDDAELGRKNVSAILIQVKNDRKFSITPRRWLFDGMNPFFVGVFDHSDNEPLPVIRMVFALSSAKSGVTIMEPGRTRYPRKAKKTKGKKSPPYTSYDIWCAGAFAETFAVIDKAEEGTYAQLLKVCKLFPESYESRLGLPRQQARRRSMYPGNMTDENHWRAFRVTEEGGDEEMDEYDYDVESEQD